MLEVPKVIWQTHEWDYEDLPQNFKAAALTWQNLNPDWEYRYVTAAEREEQIKAKPEHFLLYLFYLATDKVTQSDIWRYITLYENGGAYADMDSVCAEPLDYSLRNVQPGTEIVCTDPDENGDTNNANFVADKLSRVLHSVLEDILNNIYMKVSLISILNTATDTKVSLDEALKVNLRLGPGAYSRVLKQFEPIVCREYRGAIHSSDIKKDDYKPKHVVNYYGNPFSYVYLAEKNNWSLT
jgi:hypothetical protein